MKYEIVITVNDVADGLRDKYDEDDMPEDQVDSVAQSIINYLNNCGNDPTSEVIECILNEVVDAEDFVEHD